MLDGRVLGASQVEYKPFGKLPLKRESLRPGNLDRTPFGAKKTLITLKLELPDRAKKTRKKGVETLRRLGANSRSLLISLGLGCSGNQRVGRTNQMSGGWRGQTVQNRAKRAILTGST